MMPYLVPADGWSVVKGYDLRTGARCSRVMFRDASAATVVASLESIGFEPSATEGPLANLAICQFISNEIGGVLTVFARPLGAGGGQCEFAAVRADGALFFWSPG